MLTEAERARLSQSVGRLDALSPLAVLGRGYSIVRTAEHVVQSAEGLKEGDRLEVRFRSGGAQVRVESTTVDPME